MRAALILLPLLIGACTTTKTITRDVPVEVQVPVPQACAGPRPEPVVPLKDRVTVEEWESFDHVQKSAYVAEQGFARQTYGEQLDAATAACP